MSSKIIFTILCSFFLSTTLFSQKWNKLDDGKFKFNGAVKSVYCDSKGKLYVGGFFTNDSGYYYIACWDENGWSELGGKNGLRGTGCVLTITGDKDGNIFAAGNFRNADQQAPYVAKKKKKKWTELGKENSNSLNANWNIRSICTDNNGNLFAVGGFNDGIGKYVAQWSKRSNRWSIVRNTRERTIQSRNPLACILSAPNGDLFVAGSTDSAGKKNVMQWKQKDTAWSILGDKDGLKANASIETICSDNNGNIYAAGLFTNGKDSLNGSPYVAKWDGNSWTELKGTNPFSFKGSIYTTFFDQATNSLYAAGEFEYQDGSGNSYKYVAKWNGTNWTDLGGEDFLKANNTIETIFCDNLGNIYAGGWFTEGEEFFVAKYSNVVLDVKVKDFRSVASNNYVAISWSTSNEHNVQKILIERSSDGTHFLPVKTILPLNNSNNTYQYNDRDINISHTSYFYRLKIVNKDGSVHYSETLNASIKSQDRIQLLGNPVKNGTLFLSVYANSNKNTSIAINNLSGSCLFNKSYNITKGFNYLEINIASLPKGVYALKAENIGANPFLFMNK